MLFLEHLWGINTLNHSTRHVFARKNIPNQNQLFQDSCACGTLRLRLFQANKQRPVKVFRWRWPYFRFTGWHHLTINLIFAVQSCNFILSAPNKIGFVQLQFLSRIYSVSYQQSRCILLEETHSQANSQMNLVLQIFSKCDLLQRNRTMLKNSVVSSVFKRNVRNVVYIICRE